MDKTFEDGAPCKHIDVECKISMGKIMWPCFDP